MVRNPNKDSISNIRDWLKKQEVDIPIPDKGRDRVLTEMAKQIRMIKPLPIGACSICSTHSSEGLVPIPMRLCLNCCKQFIKKGGGLRVGERKIGDYWCDNCLQRSIITFITNPYICRNCLQKIGRRHQFHVKDMKRDMREFAKKKDPMRRNRDGDD